MCAGNITNDQNGMNCVVIGVFISNLHKCEKR